MKKIAGFGAFLVGCSFALLVCMPFISATKNCTGTSANTTAQSSDLKPTKAINVGLLQMMSHPSPDDIRKGIYDGLAERGYKNGKNIKIDYRKAFYDVAGRRNLPEICRYPAKFTDNTVNQGRTADIFILGRKDISVKEVFYKTPLTEI